MDEWENKKEVAVSVRNNGMVIERPKNYMR
jgi:hypothetical protein